MKNIILAVALSTLVIGCFPTAGITEETTSAAEFKVCAISALTGEWALDGQEITRGMQLAVDEINTEGGVQGRKLRLVLEDDAYEKQKTVTAARKLIQEDGCQALLVPYIESAQPIIPFLEEEKIPTIVLIDRTDDVLDYDYMLSIGFSVEGAGTQMAEYAHTQEKNKAVLVLDQIEFSLIIGEAFKRRFEELGGSVTVMKLSPNEDFLTLVTKIKDLESDVVYFALTLNSQDVFLRKIQEQQLDVLLLAPVFFNKDIIAAAGKAAEGVCKTDIPLPNSKRARILLDTYTNTYNEESVISSYMIAGYDGVNVLASAMEHAPALTGTDLQNSLLQVTDYESVIGDVVSLNNRGAAWRLEKIYCVENGELVFAEKFPRII